MSRWPAGSTTSLTALPSSSCKVVAGPEYASRMIQAYRKTCALSGILVVTDRTGQHVLGRVGRTLDAPMSSAGRNLPWLSNIIRFVMAPLGTVTKRIPARSGASGPSTCDVCVTDPRNPAYITYHGVGADRITVPGLALASAVRAVSMYERVLSLDVLLR